MAMGEIITSVVLTRAGPCIFPGDPLRSGRHGRPRRRAGARGAQPGGAARRRGSPEGGVRPLPPPSPLRRGHGQPGGDPGRGGRPGRRLRHPPLQLPGGGRLDGAPRQGRRRAGRRARRRGGPRRPPGPREPGWRHRLFVRGLDRRARHAAG